MPCVVMVLVVLSAPFILGISWIPPDLHGFYMWVFEAMDLLNDLLSRLLSVVGILVFVSGLGGFGKILVPGCMLGFGLILFLSLPSW